jgi:hypothetical protein
VTYFMVVRWRKVRLFLLQCVRQFLALNRHPRHGYARQVLGEDRSRQPMIGAAVYGPIASLRQRQLPHCERFIRP